MTALTSAADVHARLAAGLYAVFLALPNPSQAHISVFRGDADDVWVNLDDDSDLDPLDRDGLFALTEQPGGLLFAADHAFRVDSPAKLRTHPNGSIVFTGDGNIYRSFGGDLHALPERRQVTEADFWRSMNPSEVLVIWDACEFVPF